MRHRNCIPGWLGDTIARRLAFVRAVTATIEAACNICRPYGYTDGDLPFVYPIMVDSARLSCSPARFAEAGACGGDRAQS